jgi:hypothetical protein
MPSNVFISYSHIDTDLVAPVVQLLRAMAATVFHDATSIIPGTKWREEIEKAIEACDLCAVFWCEHSAGSEEVKSEYEMALNSDKKLMAVLLDSMVMPEKLRQFHGVDLRPLVMGKHARHHVPNFPTEESSFPDTASIAVPPEVEVAMLLLNGLERMLGPQRKSNK